MDFTQIINGIFVIRGGRFQKGKYGHEGYTEFRLTPWGSYPNQYRISGDYSAADYWIGKDGYGDWYIYKGTWQTVCRLFWKGGLDWDSYM